MSNDEYNNLVSVAKEENIIGATTCPCCSRKVRILNDGEPPWDLDEHYLEEHYTSEGSDSEICILGGRKLRYL